MITFRALTAEDAKGVARVERESFPTPWSREDFWREASNIALTETRRGRGLGCRLMEAMMRAAAARGAERMTLEVRPSNAAALHLYERLGFSAVGVRKKYYQDNDEDAILMWHTKLKEMCGGAASGAPESVAQGEE